MFYRIGNAGYCFPSIMRVPRRIRMKKILLPLLFPILAALVFTGLLYVDFYRSLDSRLYDLLLRLKPAIDEDDSILLVEVDDLTISEVNMYPLGRDIFADGLILMKEFNPAWTMLDIEFVDRSPAGINLNYLDYGIPDELTESFTTLTQYQRQLVELILSGQVTQEEALGYLSDLETMGWSESDRLYEAVKKVAFDKDVYLGQAIAYLGNVTATINMTETYNETVSDELRSYARETLNVSEYLTLNENPFEKAVDILPSIMDVTKSAAWAGFPRMHIDSDGVRRRVDMLFEQDGDFYTHMGFGTWWLREGKPPITVFKNRLSVGDITIPLDRDGKMLINWPKRLFDGTPLGKRAARGYDPAASTQRLSFYYLYHHDLLFRDLSNYISELEYYNITSDVYGGTPEPLSLMDANLNAMKERMLSEGNGERSAEYGSQRDDYLDTAQTFLMAETENRILDDLTYVLNDPELDTDTRAAYEDLLARVPVVFSDSRAIVADLLAVRAGLRERISGSTIVVGYTGTSTSDYGANPFEKKYMNMGIYGAVYNSFLQREFLQEIPTWITGLIAFIAGIGVMLVANISKKNSSINTISGAGLLLLIVAGAGILFMFTGVYIHMLSLILVLLSAYLGSIIGNFLTTSKDKAFIQDAFGQIISPDVVKEIQDNPNILNISGTRRNITAMFTDIRGFSTISEEMGSSDKLFELLRRYLTPMCDIILDERGTIDKYEGDAIISFWNAPLNQEDHAHRACRAAMRMVKAEQELNTQLMAEGVITAPLFTRFGINTGENNIGFIGTQKRKDYTALGDEMNLAARLEGVNKLYGTQVLISGVTENIIHTSFITRQLDMVRVVGKEKPVTLYELTCFKEDFNDVERQCFNNYREALKFFREKEWDKSEELFRSILEKIPDDGPSKVFVERCVRYRENPPSMNWDGVYKMESK